MNFPCLFVLFICVAFNEVIPGPVPGPQAKPAADTKDTTGIQKQIVDNVRDALTTDDGKQALKEVLDNLKNKKDEGKDKEVDVTLDANDNKGKESVEDDQTDALKNLIINDVEDALKEGEGKAAIEQLLDETSDGAAGSEDSDDVPEAIEDELEQGETSDEALNDDDEEDFHDTASDSSFSDATPSNRIAGLDVEGMLADSNDLATDHANDETTADLESQDADTDYFVSDPFTEASEDEQQGDLNDEPAASNLEVGPADITDFPAGPEPNGADSKDALAEDTDLQDADTGYFVSDPFTEDKKTGKDEQPADNDNPAASNPAVVPADITESSAGPEPVAAKDTPAGPEPVAAKDAPAGPEPVAAKDAPAGPEPVAAKDAPAPANIVPAASVPKAKDEPKA